ncbi:MAG: MerR family transcriptional regulator [Sporolactobacillus sp.]
MYYTAKQLTDKLVAEGAAINLRTVRYYTQIDLIPPLEMVGKKRVYSDLHYDYLRAIVTLSKMGDTLASIKERLKNLSPDELKKIADPMQLYCSENLTTRETTKINADAFITLSTNVNPSVRQKIVDSVSKIMKEDGPK